MESVHPSNPKLRAARLSRNWTLNDAARELRTLMTSRGETQTGVNRHHVYRWERGFRRPDMRYRRYLCLLYGLRPDQLGFLPTDYTEPDLAPQAGQAAPLEINGHTTHSSCSEDDLELLNLTRRKLLVAFGYLGAAAGTEMAGDALAAVADPLERAARIASGRAAADNQLVADLTNMTIGYDRARRTIPGNLLVEPVRAHINLIVRGVLKQSLLPEQREALLINASLTSKTMALLQFNDLGNQAAGRRALAESIEMGEATHDTGVQALGLVTAAEWHTSRGQGNESLQILSQAHRLAERACTPNVRSWVLAAQAEAHAKLRQPKEASWRLGLAEQALARTHPGDEPWWADFWGRSKVNEYTGTVHLHLEQPRPARVALHKALAGLRPASVKARAVYLVDLATTYAQELEIEAACELAGKALDIAGPLQHQRSLERMASLRGRLARWPANRAVRNLDDRLAALGSA